jgi:hypothetical protein
MSLYETHLQAVAVFDVRDRFLADRRTSGPRPRPLGRLRFRIEARQSDGQMRPLPSPLDMHTSTTPSGLHAFFGQYTTGRELISYRLSPGLYRARVLGDYYQPSDPADFTVTDPPPPTPSVAALAIDLLPALNYPFPPRTTRLFGAFIHQPAGGQPAPVAGVTVQAFDAAGNPLSAPGATDVAGSWLLVFVSRLVADANNEAVIRLQFTLPDGRVFQAPNERIVRYMENRFPPRVFI